MRYARRTYRPKARRGSFRGRRRRVSARMRPSRSVSLKRSPGRCGYRL